MTLGERLKTAREEKEYTQTSVAKLTGINNKTLSNWENDVSKPAPDDLAALASLYNISVDWLVGNTIIRTPLGVLAGHRSDDFRHDLPPEQVQEIEHFIAYQYAQLRAKQQKEVDK
jgi:transcriptional regulator with XRE-family HTH domain